MGIAGALIYGALKLNWTFNGTLGLQGTPPWETRTAGWAHASDLVLFLAFEGTVLLALAAIVLLIALIRPPLGLPRRLLAAAAWLGCLLVGGAWLVGTAGLVAGEGGPGADPSLTAATFWALWASFGMLGGGFGATAWLTRSRERA